MSEPLKKIYDFGNVTYRFIMNNYKSLLATLMGLVIALTIISTSVMLIDSYRNKFAQELLFSEWNEVEGDIQIELYPHPEYGETVWVKDYAYYKQLITTSFGNAGYNNYFEKQYWFTEIELVILYEEENNSNDYYLTRLKAMEEELFTKFEPYLNPGGRLPENSFEVIMISKGSVLEFEVGHQVTIDSRRGTFSTQPTNVTIVGIVEYQEVESLVQEYLSKKEDPFWFSVINEDWGEAVSNCIILTYPNYVINIIEQVRGNSDFISITKIFGKIHLDHSQFDVFNCIGEISKLNALLGELSDNTFAEENNYADILGNSNAYALLDNLEKLVERMQLLQLLLLLIDLPVIAIALYLVSYSFTLVKRQKKETIGIIKTRGGSWQQILLLLLGETVISITLATIGGLILGFILTTFVLRSINFLDFTGTGMQVIISPTLILILIPIAVVITFFLNLSTIIYYGRMTILESINPIEKRSPIWKRYFFDIIFTILGLIGYYVIVSLSGAITSGENSSLVFIVFLFLGVPAPFFLFFGSILLISRLFPFLINQLAQISWKIRGKLFSFSLRNVVRHKQTATRVVILITLAISYTIISASLAFSIDETKRAKCLYDTGADMSINIDYLNENTIDFLLNNVSGITSISQTLIGHTPSAHGLHYYSFLFLDPTTYSEVAYFDESLFGLSSPLSTLMTKLVDNQSILLYRGNFDVQPNLKINDQFIFHFYNKTLFASGGEALYNYTIVGSFSHWPQQYEFPGAPDNYIFAVGSLEMFFSLIKYEYLSISDTRFLIDLEPNCNVEQVTNIVGEYVGQPMSTGLLDYQEYQESIDRYFGISVLNSALLVCIAVSIVGVLMFSLFTYIERGKEIGVERALGMTRTQTGISFIFEGLSILFFGIVIGLITGLVNTTFFLLITQMGRTVPPIVVAYPFDFIFRFLAFIVLVNVVGNLILAYKASRKDISRVLKVE